MLSTGSHAPSFQLPAVGDGDVTLRSLDDAVDGGAAVLAFHLAPLSRANPSTAAALLDLDWIDLERGVTAYAVAPGAIEEHRQFVREWGKSAPLLVDVHGRARSAYDVDGPDEPDVAVYLIDQDRRVCEAWRIDGNGLRRVGDATKRLVTNSERQIDHVKTSR